MVIIGWYRYPGIEGLLCVLEVIRPALQLLLADLDVAATNIRQGLLGARLALLGLAVGDGALDLAAHRLRISGGREHHSALWAALSACDTRLDRSFALQRGALHANTSRNHCSTVLGLAMARPS